MKKTGCMYCGVVRRHKIFGVAARLCLVGVHMNPHTSWDYIYWRVLEEGDDRTMHGEFLDIVLDDCMWGYRNSTGFLSNLQLKMSKGIVIAALSRKGRPIRNERIWCRTWSYCPSYSICPWDWITLYMEPGGDSASSIGTIYDFYIALALFFSSILVPFLLDFEFVVWQTMTKTKYYLGDC